MSVNCPQCSSVMLDFPEYGATPPVITYVCPWGHAVKFGRLGETFICGLDSRGYYEDALERFHALKHDAAMREREQQIQAEREAREEAHSHEHHA